MVNGPPSFAESTAFPRDAGKNCKAVAFSKDGSLFAWCNGEKVNVVNVTSAELLRSFDLPKTVCLEFSPKNTVLATWQPYTSECSTGCRPAWGNSHLNWVCRLPVTRLGTAASASWVSSAASSRGSRVSSEEGGTELLKASAASRSHKRWIGEHELAVTLLSKSHVSKSGQLMLVQTGCLDNVLFEQFMDKENCGLSERLCPHRHGHAERSPSAEAVCCALRGRRS
nr:uncharacterized protein LOC102098449 [Columba livia]